MLVPVRHQEFNVIAHSTSNQHRIVKIRFQRDGSIFVMFPSFKENEGLVGKATLLGGVKTTACNLAELGKITSSKVKYSHHSDGRVHFSQDGLVKTEIKKQSVPLALEQLHMFTVHAEGLDGFSAPRSNDTTHKLEFLIQGGTPAVKLVASWCELKNLGSTVPLQTGSGTIMMRFPNGQVQPSWLISPPEGNLYDRFGLIVTAEETSSLSSEAGCCLTFIGGFDPRHVALDYSRETSFLLMKYPCTSPEELRRSIGSIDLVRRTKH